MHCKDCLKKSHYFSKCMHPYCETCYNLKIYCNYCKTGKKELMIYSILRYLNLYK